tara:strand:+ start:898 stop:1554 length:657 start_codon:yes stop_codon:yes gene_type:complete
MCGRFDTSQLTWADIHAQLSVFARIATSPLNIEPDDDVRPTTRQLVARLQDGAWTGETMRWGLVPGWRSGKPLKDTAKGKGDGFKLTTFNARAETVAGSAVFRDAFARRRCLVPASAWYEWTGDKGAKTRWRVSRADDVPMLMFAGLWDHADTADAGPVDSFTVLTHPSSGLLADYHDRAPVVLERDDWMRWLDVTRDPAPLFANDPGDRFQVTPVTD